MQSRLKEVGRKVTADRVHDARVALRRLGALLDLLRAVAPAPSLRKLHKRLRKPLKRLGPMRDLHVQGERVAELATAFPELEGVQTWLGRQERKATKDARRYARDLDLGKLRNAFRRVQSDLALQLISARQDRHLERAVQAVSDAFADVGEHRGRLSVADVSTIHAMRVAFKRFRYRVEVLRPLLREVGDGLFDAMHACQTRMGDIQDLHVLLDTISERKGTDRVREELGRRLMLAADAFVRDADEVFTFWHHDFIP